ncbi:MAG: gliding motility-associated C-terminal domain-containing protein [Bacteroidota bacterium]
MHFLTQYQRVSLLSLLLFCLSSSFIFLLKPENTTTIFNFAPPTFGPCDTVFLNVVGEDNSGQKEGFFTTINRNGELFACGFTEGGPTLFKFSQNGQLQWTRLFNSLGSDYFILDMYQDSEGFLILFGWDQSFPHNSTWIMRYDPGNDEIQWIQEYDLGEKPRLNDFLENPISGDYKVFGTTEALNNLGADGQDALQLTLDKNTGELIESEYYSLGATDAWQEAILFEDHYYVAGYVRNGNVDGIRPCIGKFTLDGELLWSNYYLNPFFTPSRSYMEDLVIENNSIYSVGRGSLSDADLSNGRIQWFQTDLDGMNLSTRAYEIIGSSSLSTRGILSIEDGLLIYGVLEINGQRDLFLTKINKDGDGIWCKGIGLENANDNSFYHTIIDGFLYLGGQSVTGTQTDAFFLKISINDPGILIDCDWIRDLELREEDGLEPFHGDAPLLRYNHPYTLIPRNSLSTTLASPIATACMDTILCSPTNIFSPNKPINRVYIPNAFSPNNDGNNDSFYPFSESGNLRVIQCSIFDRKGNLVFQNNSYYTNDPSQGWDGTFHGQPLNSGVYTYIFEIENDRGEHGILHGDISLFR